MNIVETTEDAKLFARWFGAASWAAWKVILKAVFCLALLEAESEIYGKLTGRKTIPKELRELWLVCGRRAGKTKISALIAVYLAFFKTWREVLSPGERGVIMIICPDRRQGRVTLGYILGLMEGNPMLKSMVEQVTKESILLTNRIVIEIHTCSYRSVRGYTVVAAICDEIAFWRSEESANPDSEILTALRPAMATVPGALLICLSTPYSRRGALWEAYSKHFGRESDNHLVIQAATKELNPAVPDHVIEQAYEEDPAAAAAEWGAEFRKDIESYVSREAVESCVIPNRHELPPVSSLCYAGFVDPSGGSSDSMTLAVAHKENGEVIIDTLRERRPPFSPESVVEEFSALLKQYRVSKVLGDRFGGEWPREQFRNHGIEYELVDASKSELYVELLPALNSGKVELLDHLRLKTQLLGLERRTSRAGKDSIDHGVHGHDDLANVVAMAACRIKSGPSVKFMSAGKRSWTMLSGYV